MRDKSHSSVACDLRRESFTIDSAEGLPIRGVIESAREPEGLVFLLHGFKGFKDWGFFPWLSSSLAEAGLAVCRFDFSRNGVSEGSDVFDRLDLFENDTYSIQLSDLARVVEHVTSQEHQRDLPVSLLGYSRGAAIALLGSERVANLRTVVTWSGISSLDRWDEATVELWTRNGYSTVINARTKQEMRISRAMYDDYVANAERLNVLAAVRRLTVPLLVVHGDRDETVDVSEATKIANAARDASLLVIGGGSHSFCAIHPLITVPLQLSVATEVTARFLGV